MEEDVNKKLRSKLAVISFILCLMPILMILLYIIVFRSFLLNSPIIITLGYNLIIQYIPIVSLILSIISLILIRMKKSKGLGFAISGLIISLIEVVLFFVITAKFL